VLAPVLIFGICYHSTAPLELIFLDFTKEYVARFKYKHSDTVLYALRVDIPVVSAGAIIFIGFFDEPQLINDGSDLSLPEKFSSRSFANFKLIFPYSSVGKCIAEIRGGRNFTLDFNNLGNKAVCKHPSILFLSQKEKVLEYRVEFVKDYSCL
jgi:hypothetical protein